VPRASSRAAPRHTSTATGKPRWDEGFPGMPQASSPIRTAISKVFASDGQDPRHIANTSAAHLTT